jgi:hypothetical protein
MASAATVSNMGMILVPQIDIISDHFLSNSGTIQSSKELSRYGNGDVHNHGIIGGEKGKASMTGERLRQYHDGNIHGNGIILHFQTTDLSGWLEGYMTSFTRWTAIVDGVLTDDVETMELATSKHFLASQGSSFRNVREPIDGACNI